MKTGQQIAVKQMKHRPRAGVKALAVCAIPKWSLSKNSYFIQPLDGQGVPIFLL
jgi:hypothetical protein